MSSSVSNNMLSCTLFFEIMYVKICNMMSLFTIFEENLSRCEMLVMLIICIIYINCDEFVTKAVNDSV